MTINRDTDSTRKILKLLYHIPYGLDKKYVPSYRTRKVKDLRKTRKKKT
jgi:hypothetical protein